MNASTTQATNGFLGHDATADSTAVLSALNDAGCRRILAACDEAPLTARECAAECDVPLSTVYRKIGMLTDASLLEEGRRISMGNNHPREFSTSFSTLSVSLQGNEGIDVSFLQVATDGGDEEGEF